MKPFFTYFGGKWRSAPRYPLPGHNIIVEPFAGSAGYPVRHSARNVFLYDLDEKVIGVWDYLIRTPAPEISNLPLDVSEGVDALKVPQEAKWLIGFWLNKGAAQPCKTPSAWMRKGTHTNSFWGEVIRNRIASQVEGIRHWKCYHRPYVDVCSFHNATWFVDPPYQKAGKDYRCSSTNIDFQHLGEWCKSRNGQVLVCENEGADWLDFKPFLAQKATHGSGRSGVSMEVLYEQNG